MSKERKLNGKVNTAIASVQNLYSSFYGRIIIDTLTYSPLWACIVYATSKQIKEKVDDHLPQGVVNFLDSYLLLIFIFSVAFSYLLKNILPLIVENQMSPEKYLNVERFLELLESLESIVHAKIIRFQGALPQPITNDSQNSADIFKTITKPEQQIVVIIYALQAWLERLFSDADIDVRLIEVKDKEPINWYTYAPKERSPKTTIEQLKSNPDTALMNCIRKPDMIVIEDIQSELKRPNRKYVQFDDEDGTGSMLCYSIYHEPTKEHPFVITVKSSKPRNFISKKKGYYRWILSRFSQRIQLEYNLILLKSSAKND